MRVKSHRLLKKKFASYMYYIEYQRVITHERKTMSLFQYGGDGGSVRVYYFKLYVRFKFFLLVLGD